MQDKEPKVGIVEAIASFASDPYGYVLFNYPWGEKGTPLEKETGPDEWQADVLCSMRDQLQAGRKTIQVAVKSGHGVGKGALTSWIVQWFMSCRQTPEAIITANTQNQLFGKTWRELSKWHKMSRNRDWFEWTNTQFKFKAEPETWFAHAVPWTKERSEAFAGAHESSVLFIFDEASAIDDKIWEVTEGASTTNEFIWLAFGNPTRNTGRFRECWGKSKDFWTRFTVDARNAKMVRNKEKIEEWLKTYGEDSDFFRIRVRGDWPRQSVFQFIGEDLVRGAQERDKSLPSVVNLPVLLGVDVGMVNKTVLTFRQGPRIIHKISFTKRDTMQIAYFIAEQINKWKPAATVIDAQGLGAGVYHRLLELGFAVIGANTALPAMDDNTYHNIRAELWDKMKEWLKTGAISPQDEDLFTDLTGIEYKFDNKNRYLMERKEDMFSRGLSSPDDADSLSLTFFVVPPQVDDSRMMPEALVYEDDAINGLPGGFIRIRR